MEQIITVDGQPLSLNIVRPANTDGVLPAFVFFHGGGWLLGDYFTHKRSVRDLVVASGVAGVFVNYTPSSAARYPVAIQQAYAATRWVAEHSNAIDVDGTRLAVAGNSVGGNMATVVSLLAKEHGTPSLACQILLWPVTDANFATDSYQHYPEGYFLTKGMTEWFWDTTRPIRPSARRLPPRRCGRCPNSWPVCRLRWCRWRSMTYCMMKAWPMHAN